MTWRLPLWAVSVLGRFAKGRGGEPIYQHRPHELLNIAGGPERLNSYWPIDLLFKHLLIMEFRFDAILGSNLGN